jgi:hypothetical protein
VGIGLLGGVFRRQPESVPTHGVEHVLALGAVITRHDIAHGIVADVAHVNAARRIGEHLEHVIMFARIVILDDKRLTVGPNFLPVGFLLTRIITFNAHVLAVLFF